MGSVHFAFDGRKSVRDIQEHFRLFTSGLRHDHEPPLPDSDCSVDVRAGGMVFQSHVPSLISDGTLLTDLPQPVSVVIRPWSRPATT